MGNSESKTALKTFYDFSIKDIYRQRTINFSEFQGKVVLAVNVASKCGLTQVNYQQLVDLADRYQAKGLEIILFPCNQFAKQEPGNEEEICHYIQGFSKKFVVTEKIDVNGKEAHEVYQWLKKQCPGTLTNAIKWNFTKVIRKNSLFSF